MTPLRRRLAVLLAFWPLALPAAAPELYAARVPVDGGALDAAFASGKPACVNVKIARSEFRKGSISV